MESLCAFSAGACHSGDGALSWTLCWPVESGGDGETGSREINQEAVAMVPSRENEAQAGLWPWKREEWSSVARMSTATQFSSVSSRASLCLPSLFPSHSFIHMLQSIWSQIKKRFELVSSKRHSKK